MGSTGATRSNGLGEIKRFSDKPIGTHEYRDNDGATAKWFLDNSNVDQLISSMDSNTQEAFRVWCEGFFMGHEQWGRWQDMSTGDRQRLSRIEKILDKSVVNNSVEVTRMSTWRLINNNSKDELSLEQLKAMKGQYIFSRGAMSTAAASQGLSISWRGGIDDPKKPVEYKIIIPAGSKGAGMWVGDKRINGWGDKQREFLMNRDSFYKVGNSHYDSKRNKTIIELIWSGHAKHVRD